jgi:hypothetical protein
MEYFVVVYNDITCVEDDTIPFGIPVKLAYGKVPVWEPLNDPVNEPVKEPVLTCDISFNCITVDPDRVYNDLSAMFNANSPSTNAEESGIDPGVKLRFIRILSLIFFSYQFFII